MISASQISQWEAEVEAWKETARQHCRNEEYYRGLVQSIGQAIGHEAYISDDGSVQQDVLCAKVPELVKTLIARSEFLVGSHIFTVPILDEVTGDECGIDAYGCGCCGHQCEPEETLVHATDCPLFGVQPVK